MGIIIIFNLILIFFFREFNYIFICSETYNKILINQQILLSGKNITFFEDQHFNFGNSKKTCDLMNKKKTEYLFNFVFLHDHNKEETECKNLKSITLVPSYCFPESEEKT